MAMASRAGIATLLLTFFLTNPPARAQAPQPGPLAGVQGTVLGADGRPVSGIHIELDDPSTALPVTSTYTQPDGTFELYNIPKGNYEVIAESADMQVSGAVALDTERPSLELRLPKDAPAPIAMDATTSVAHLLVPAKAQRLYNRASAHFTAGKYDEAAKEVDLALQLHPEYADALTLRGLLELRQPDISVGQQTLEQAVKLDPSQSAAYVALAAVYNHQGRFDDAMRVSEKGLSLAPRTWQAYMEMAKASIAKSMYQSGLKFIRQAERLGGSAYGEVHLVKAYALIPLKLYKDARYELQASITRERHGRVADQAKNVLASLQDMESVQTASNR